MEKKRKPKKKKELEQHEVILNMFKRLDSVAQEVEDEVGMFINVDLDHVNKVELLGLIMAFKDSRGSASETYRVEIYEALEKKAGELGMAINGKEKKD